MCARPHVCACVVHTIVWRLGNFRSSRTHPTCAAMHDAIAFQSVSNKIHFNCMTNSVRWVVQWTGNIEVASGGKTNEWINDILTWKRNDDVLYWVIRSGHAKFSACPSQRATVTCSSSFNVRRRRRLMMRNRQNKHSPHYKRRNTCNRTEGHCNCPERSTAFVPFSKFRNNKTFLHVQHILARFVLLPLSHFFFSQGFVCYAKINFLIW